MIFEIIILLLNFLIISIESSLDISLQEWKFLADHLSDHDCKRLVAALHDANYDIKSNLDLAANTISEDVSCLNLLLHWNSSPNEGDVQSHSILSHRLNQLNHEDLAEWLSNTVFKEMDREINETLLENPFYSLANTESTKIVVIQTNDLIPTYKEPDEWLPLDTIGMIIFGVLISLTLMLILKTFLKLFRKSSTKRNDAKEKLNQEKDNSSGEDSTFSVKNV